MAKIIISITLIFCLLTISLTLTARSPFPLETLYVQTDKQNYFTGENIWFRAYLVCSQTHVQIAYSRYIYAELINSQREVINRVMIRHDENGVFAGHIPIFEDLEAGAYNLRFFTRHLENFGEEYFFKRGIHIITPQSLEESRLSEQAREDYLPEERISTPIPAESFAVSFHPEGGDIPIGIETLIAFNAINSTGLGEHIHGVIVNARGDTITHIESAHLGMGAFELLVNSDELLFAVVQNAAGLEKRVELPRAKEDAISLQVFRQEENIIVYLPGHDNRVLYLTLQYRGISHSERWNNESEILVISEDELPMGVIGIVLSDSQGIPLSKRQIFNINKTKTVNTTFTTESETHEARERVNATVTITDSENRPLRADFSISVIDNDVAQYDASINILSTLLLTSDLRGHIEDPAYYFMAENENAKEHLDLVMLTHGWSRFEVSRVYQEETITVWQDFETSQTITGTLRGGFLRRSANQPVNLLAPLFGFFDVVYTDREGRFRFEHFEFPEGTEFVLQSIRYTEIDVDEEAFPTVTDFFIPTKANNMPVFNHELIEEFHRLTSEDDIWSLELDEFVFIHRMPRSHRYRRMEREEIERYERMFENNLFYLVRDRLRHQGLEAFTDVDRFGVGLDIDGGNAPFIPSTKLAFWPPPGTRYETANEALIIIDDRRVTSNCLRNFFVRGTESIRVITDQLVLPRGYNGAIIITTDGSSFASRYLGAVRISPLGYQITQEFFSPAYTFPEQRASERPDLRTTIFWNPSVTTGEDGKAEIHFYTSDNTGNYVVVIEGITDEGGIVHLIERIR